MTDRMLDKYTRKQPDGAGSAEGDSEIAELGCFGWLRGIRDRAISLELRKTDGHILAIGYGWIEKMMYDPERG